MKEKIGALKWRKFLFDDDRMFRSFRSFQHARDEALADRDRHVQLERETQRKYDELLNEFDTSISMRNEFSAKCFSSDIVNIKVQWKFDWENYNPK